MRWPLSFLLGCLLGTTGCGYHLCSQQSRQTISIPFIKGDEDGSLTNHLIHAIAMGSTFEVISFGSTYSLEASVISVTDERIGFRFDPQKIKGEVNLNILADEGRKKVAIEVTLYKKGKVFWGPHLISQDEEYDYVDGDSFPQLAFNSSQGEQETSLSFSLGQLEPLEAARQGVKRPLYRKLAGKIANALSFAVVYSQEIETSFP